MSDEEGPKFFPATGSVIGGFSADKPGRITEALQDMELAINGMAMQFGNDGGGQGEEWTTAVAALARACSMFLRKTVLGDFGGERHVCSTTTCLRRSACGSIRW